MLEQLLSDNLIRPSAIVSTAYKAVTGLLELYTAFLNGISMILGGAERNIVAAKKNDKLIEELENAKHNPKKMSDGIKHIKKLKETMAYLTEAFAVVKNAKVFVDFTDMSASLDFQIEEEEKAKQKKAELLNNEEGKFFNEAMYSLLKILNISSNLSKKEAIELILSVISNNATKVSRKIETEDAKVLRKLFFQKVVLELTEGIKVSGLDNIKELNFYISELTGKEEEFKKALLSFDETRLKALRVLKKVYGKGGQLNEDLVKALLSEKTVEEFSRNHLYSFSNKIGHMSKLVMREMAYKEKDEVIKAIKYFSITSRAEKVQYLAQNYGYLSKNHELFLHYTAMVYPFIGSSLASITNVLPGLNEYVKPFDTVIADEAGMITSIDMIPVLAKADKAIIVGDTEQLQPIFGIDDIFKSAVRTIVNDDTFWNKYTPTDVSAFHLAANMSGKDEVGYGNAVFLNEHRRCQPNIINLCKYIVPEYATLKVKTSPLKGEDAEILSKMKHNLMMFDVINSDKGPKNNTNMDEIAKITKILDRLEAIGVDLKNDVGIISPYKNQANLLTKMFAERLGQVKGAEPRIGTVHNFQGAEYKIIIMSTVVSQKETDSLDFINNGPYMVNVAVSRAKNHLIVVGDYEKLTSSNKKDNYIGLIARMIQEQGVFVPASK